MQGGHTLTSRSKEYRLPAENRADYVRENFDAIARRYDRFNDRITFGLHRLWKRAVVRATGLKRDSGQSVLDLCSGSGDIALKLAAWTGPGARVVAYDFSPQMLAVLQARIDGARAKKSLATIEIEEGDAMDLARFTADTFDAVTIGFGLRNVTDRARCLAECLRVLRPGGRLVILDVGRVPYRIPGYVHRWFFTRIVPRIGHWTHGSRHEMYDYLPASAEMYPGQEELKREIEQAGFGPVHYRNFMLGASVMHVAQKPTGEAIETISRRR